jgi:enoyl-CoA hydratase/carnithine racemase
MSDFRYVDVEKRDRISIVSLDRAEALNAISGAMAEELTSAFRAAATDVDVWVVLLRANGSKSFCVGADLKERRDFSIDDFRANRKQVRGMFESLRAVPQPVIVAPFGFALGGGMELVLSADIVVAAQGTVFGLPEARVGMLPAGGATQLLPRKVGLGRAKDLIFRGSRFGTDEAVAMGLVNHVAPVDQLDRRALELADEVCGSSPVAVRAAKRAIDSTFGLAIEEGVLVEHDEWRLVIESEDRSEGIGAFNEGRPPVWKNR